MNSVQCRWRLAGTLLAWALLLTVSAPGAESKPLARWALAGNALDSGGHEHHGSPESVDLTARGPSGTLGRATGFDGRNSRITVADAPGLDLGTGEFSIAAWIHTNADLDDALGDILSKYDPATRHGFQLSVLHLTGVTTSQPNARHLFFGIDAGRQDASWTDCGRPGNNLFVFALAVHRDELFAGTFERGTDEAGHVYRYGGGSRWIDCGSPDDSNAVQALAVHSDRLYAGTGRYMASGSSLPESPNQRAGGRIYSYEGVRDWVDCGKLGNQETGDSFTVGGLATFRGDLYAGVSKPPGRGLYRYDGGTSWTYLGNPGHRVTNPVVFNGGLYLASLDGGGVTRYDDELGRFLDCGRPEGVTQTYGFAIHEGALYASSWPGGEVFRYGGGTSWTSTGRLGGELETMGMAVYNGKLYAGTLPLAEVYRYDGGTRWTSTGQLDITANVRYRRAWSMAIHRGKLYCGTLPSGHVYAFEAGKSVTHGKALPPGWCHVAAVRANDELRLYLNGTKVATSERFVGSDYDVSNQRPLLIGLGPNDHWNGRLKDVSLFDNALEDSAVAALAAEHRRFRLATFSAEVTIPVGHRCMGVLPRKAETILDPLEAKGFVLLGAGRPLVLVAVDWCEIRNGAYDQWRDALARAAATTRERVLVASLHQHDAPVVDQGAQKLLDAVGLRNELYDPAFHEKSVERVASALRTSLASSRPVTQIGLGRSRVERIASNRRVVEPDGKVTFHRGSNSGSSPHYRDAPVGLIDPYLSTLSFWDDDTPLLALHAYATHPMSYYGNAEVSADFVGHARRRFAKEHPTIEQIYVSGCSGDVTAGKHNDGSPANRPVLAHRLFEAMAAAWQSTVRTPLHQIHFRNTRFDLPFHDGEAFREASLRETLEDDSADVRQRILAAMGLSSLERIARNQKIDLPVIDLGPAQIVLFPGETFVGYQLLAQRLRPEQFIVSIGYGECWPGYIPSASAFAEDFGSSWRWVAPGADQSLRAALKEVLQAPRLGGHE